MKGEAGLGEKHLVFSFLSYDKSKTEDDCLPYATSSITQFFIGGGSTNYPSERIVIG